MRTIKENFEDKARLVGDISDFIDALEHPLEKDDDKDATLCITIQESGVRTTRLYSKHELAFETPSMWSDGTIKETDRLLLDKETRNCIVSGLKERLCQLKKELKDLLNE
jgi:hypothetical protein